MNDGLYSSDSAEWRTPPDLFARLDEVWHFNLDPASTPENALCARYFTAEENGLTRSWAGYRVWLNPPYGREIGKWVEKARQEGLRGGTVVVCLLPARTDAAWWQRSVLGMWPTDQGAALIRYLPGRLKFSGSKNAAPFPSAIAIFGSLAG